MIPSSKHKAMPQTLTLNHVSPATRLLEKRRQMFEVQEALDAQKEEFARREDAFRRREEGLRKKDLELQESLIKFNKFLQENESKRNRAIKRASDERKQRESKEQEIDRLKQTLQSCNEECQKLGSKVEKNVKYTKYLELVQEAVVEDYSEISDLVNRCKTLQDANNDLKQNQQAHENENESKRVDFVSFTKERTTEILNFNNEIAKLQKQLETCESTGIILQNEADVSIRNTSDKTLELGQILMAVGNLVRRCTCGIHGVVLKHAEKSSSSGDGAAALGGSGSGSGGGGGGSSSGSGSGSGSGGGGSGGSGSGSGGGRNNLVVDHNTPSWDADVHGPKAMRDLDTIAAYMTDFAAVVEARVEQQRQQKRTEAAAAAGGIAADFTSAKSYQAETPQRGGGTTSRAANANTKLP